MVLEDGLTGLMLTVELLLVAAGEALGDQALLSLFEETQLWVLARRTEYVPCDKSKWGRRDAGQHVLECLETNRLRSKSCDGR